MCVCVCVCVCVSQMQYSVQFSCSVVSDSLRPHESQHTRPPCPSPTPGVHPDLRPSSQWCHSAISSSVIPFTSCPQSLPASESFPMSQLFAWGGQSTGVLGRAITLLYLKSLGLYLVQRWADLAWVWGQRLGFWCHDAGERWWWFTGAGKEDGWGLSWES